MDKNINAKNRKEVIYEVNRNLSIIRRIYGTKKGVTTNNTRSKTKRNASLVKPITKI